jgi:hypothetical protein
MMAVFVSCVAAILIAVSPAYAERLWMVVGASDASLAQIAKKAKPLFERMPHGLIVRTADCGDKKAMFAWVAEVLASAEEAKTALSELKRTIPNAYIKSCEVKPKTLLALRVTTIDPSIADVPDNAVNWDDDDRVSIVRTLPDGRAFLVVRYYEKSLDDPLEGRRERVIIKESPQTQHVLEERCTSPGGLALRGQMMAFHCVREQAGDHLLHVSVVFAGNGTKLTEVVRCRNPKFSGPGAISCQEEAVDANGNLQLRPRQVDLGPASQPER